MMSKPCRGDITKWRLATFPATNMRPAFAGSTLTWLANLELALWAINIPPASQAQIPIHSFVISPGLNDV